MTELSRDQIASRYLEQLPFPPYPVQEEALLHYFTAEQGVLVCAPTGTGKTLIAEAALFEALHSGTSAYYTTPLIALTEQKFAELQAAAVRWGFSEEDVGLATGNRRVNPSAPIQVVVAEILLNRLLHHEAFDFSDVSAVVMDEFHQFSDPERGIVWELTLGLLPAHVRLLLLSATVGNAFEFTMWLKASHNRSLELVQGTERKVPLDFRWVGDQLLSEQMEILATGTEESRYTPALLFCFNRDECWSVADLLKGKTLLADGQQARLTEQISRHSWSQGAGPRLKQLLLRGVGIHHAGILPKYRRIIEDLFQQKLLSVCVCTETLAAGINLPARSVVLPTLMKGPFGQMKIIDPSSAHQIFGRAGRPQYDSRGYVFVLAHEDDVKHQRWKIKYDQIPEDTKDPQLIRAKKDLKRKMPARRSTEQYWTEAQFEKLRLAPPAKLASRGPLPWRLLAYMLAASPEVAPIRKLVGRRLHSSGSLIGAQKELDRMLLTMWAAGYVQLEPEPPAATQVVAEKKESEGAVSKRPTETERLMAIALGELAGKEVKVAASGVSSDATKNEAPEPIAYEAIKAVPTPDMTRMLGLRSINPLYGVYLVNQLGIASREERIEAIESVLEMPASVAKLVRVPHPEDRPCGPLATLRLHELLLRQGLCIPQELGQKPAEDEEQGYVDPRERVRIISLGDKLRRLFDASFPDVHSLNTQSVWAAGELIEFGGKFDKYITARGLQKQEGVIFRHVLRMILLLKELREIHPAEVTLAEWQAEMDGISEVLTNACREVDPSSTDKLLDNAVPNSDL